MSRRGCSSRTGISGRSPLDIGVERSEVMLQAGDERDMLDGARRRDRVEQRADDAGVDLDVFFFGRLPGPVVR